MDSYALKIPVKYALKKYFMYINMYTKMFKYASKKENMHSWNNVLLLCEYLINYKTQDNNLKIIITSKNKYFTLKLNRYDTIL